jgi:hypothetical protein
MNGLPFLLLITVAVRHAGADFLAQLYPDPLLARKAIFYVLGGMQGVLLYAVVWSLTPFKPHHVRIGVSLACTWGILEEFEVAACRIAHGIGSTASAPMWQGLCDSITGWPVTIITLVLVLIVTAARRGKGEP